MSPTPALLSQQPQESPRLLGFPATTLALIVLFLAAMDSLATIMSLRNATGRELNPIMSWLMSLGEQHFLFAKLLLTALCVQWMVRRADHPYARIAALASLAIYVPIVTLHIVNGLMTGAPA
jgi:hypothetical protein